MASLNRAAWLPSKVTKLRSGKIEHRPGGGARMRRLTDASGAEATQVVAQATWPFPKWDSEALRAGESLRAGITEMRLQE